MSWPVEVYLDVSICGVAQVLAAARSAHSPQASSQGQLLTLDPSHLSMLSGCAQHSGRAFSKCHTCLRICPGDAPPLSMLSAAV